MLLKDLAHVGVGADLVEVLAQVDPVLVVGRLPREDPHAAHTGEDGNVSRSSHRVADDDGVVRQLLGQPADHVELGLVRDETGVSVYRQVALAHVGGDGLASDHRGGRAQDDDDAGGRGPGHQRDRRVRQAGTGQDAAQA